MHSENILIEKWAKTHTSFNEVENLFTSNKNKHKNIYDTFLDEAIKNSPNGSLYYNSGFLQDLAKEKKIYLGHITYRLKDILKSGTIYSSGGCLVGSTYCFPFTKESASKFRFHNLGEYIFQEEASGRNGKKPDVILFEIDLSTKTHGNLLGINYLKLGDIHYDLFEELKYLLSSNELFNLKRTVENNIVQSLPFLKLCIKAWSAQISIESETFFRALNETVPRLSVLGYIYFESIAEYLMLYSDSIDAKKYFQRKEAYNVPYKRLLYDFYPDYKNNFRLSDFNPLFQNVCDYIKKKGFISNFRKDHFSDYISKKIVSLVNDVLVSAGQHKNVIKNKTWSTERMSELFKPLMGHLIHRELRSFGRFPDFYFYYDQLKALQIWNFWNHMGIIVPFNGVFPKAEIGINPANQELSFRAFRCRNYKKDGFLFAEPIEELQLHFVPKLVELKHTLMRNKPVKS